MTPLSACPAINFTWIFSGLAEDDPGEGLKESRAALAVFSLEKVTALGFDCERVFSLLAKRLVVEDGPLVSEVL